MRLRLESREYNIAASCYSPAVASACSPRGSRCSRSSLAAMYRGNLKLPPRDERDAALSLLQSRSRSLLRYLSFSSRALSLLAMLRVQKGPLCVVVAALYAYDIPPSFLSRTFCCGSPLLGTATK